jgi:glycosyltransferase involved in cell wall biosynthesis
MGIDPTKVPVEVVITTYNSPVFLHLVLTALSFQTLPCFSVCIADDGSGPETQTLIHQWQQQYFADRLRHVWQPDDGFQKNRILNKAISSSAAEYMVFIDGDCLAHPTFLERHLELAQRGHFVSGGLVRMPLEANQHITTLLISDGTIFTQAWLHQNHCIETFSQKLKAGLISRPVAKFLELITPVKRTWNGCNASGWRRDLLAVNGFNEEMRYGAEDVELGVRLNNAGIKTRHCRYTAPLLHMEHGRSYAHADEIARNKARVRQIKNSHETWARCGIDQSEKPQ